MTRREWKRWAWAVVAGAAVAGGSPAADKPAAQTPDKPVSEWKAGDTVPWRVDGQQDKKVTVVKVTKKPDGGREVELKDPKTGDTFTLNEGPAAAAPAKTADAPPVAVPPVPLPPVPAPADKPAAKDAGLPKAKPRADGPPVVAEAEKPADKSAEAGKPAESGKRTGPIRRLLGRMKGGPVSAETPAPTPAAPAAGPATPPAAAPVPLPARPVGKPAGDVPNAMPAKPVAPPAVGVPLPSIPVPLPPGGTSRAPTAGGVQPAGFASPAAVRTEEVRPYARLLQEAVAPSTRLVAAKALSQCRHASSDEVKGLLFAAAQADPCPSVRADCIGYLADLGYFTPAFAELVKVAAADPSDEVKAAARHAKVKMTPR